MNRMRIVLLIIDGAAVLGVVVFSVLAALERDNTLYVVGQIAGALIILGCVLLLRRINNHL